MKFCDRITVLFMFYLVQVEGRKRKTWEQCARLLEATVGGRERKWEDVKRKWTDLKVRANKYFTKKNKMGKYS